LQPSWCGFMEWIDEVKLSPTPSPELDQEYENSRLNHATERNARRRHRGEDLIWRTHMQREEHNLNQRTRQVDIREAHLRRYERRCDRHEVEIRAPRMRGMGTGRESGSE
jgi:hypothetical protein